MIIRTAPSNRRRRWAHTSSRASAQAEDHLIFCFGISSPLRLDIDLCASLECADLSTLWSRCRAPCGNKSADKSAHSKEGHNPTAVSVDVRQYSNYPAFPV